MEDTPKSRPNFSLLWPTDTPKQSASRLPDEVIRNLELEALVKAMCPYSPHQDAIRAVLYQLTPDPAIITYRQAVLSDLLDQPGLAEALKAMLPLLDELVLFTYQQFAGETSLHEVTWRAGELQLMLDCIQRLNEAFAAAAGDINSAGLRTLQGYIDQITADETFQQVVDELPAILAALRECASITIGVNLDEHLRPEEAVLLTVNSERFTASGLLERLLGKKAALEHGIAPIHSLPLVSKSDGMITNLPTAGPPERMEPMMVPLFRDLSNVLEKATRPIARELKRYVHLSSQFLANLRPEIIFYVYAVELIHKLEALGLPLCPAQVAPLAERICEVEDSYNIHLALHLSQQKPGQTLTGLVVTNDILLGSPGRIVILTGPNQGGKTTYMQAVGQVQVMAQAGLFVPGRQARVSPVDGIYTHYPVEERLELGTGRFGDEARRIRTIFEQVTRHSLVLLNESLSTTNMGESLYLAQDIVSAMRRIGLRAVYTTHLHELAAAVDELNQKTPGDSELVSMVASYNDAPEADETEASAESYSYRVVLSPPLGRSYADRIAARHGIGLAQLIELLEQRKILGDEARPDV